jgi:hypothetical protein
MLNIAHDSSTLRMPTLLAEYERVRRASIELTTALEPEDCVIQTIPEVSPTKWHLAHVTWFFERFCLLDRSESYAAFDERFLYLFNSYYYSVGPMHARPKRGLLSRPLLREVLAYREHVDVAMAQLIEARADDPAFAFLVTLGFQARILRESARSGLRDSAPVTLEHRDRARVRPRKSRLSCDWACRRRLLLR